MLDSKHLRDSLDVTQLYERLLPVENARNYFQLSEALRFKGEENAEEAAALRTKAEVYLRRRKPDATETGTEIAYNEFIPVYWR